MIKRKLEGIIKESLGNFPIVGIIGARQVGKTTLAKVLADEYNSCIYLDLERPSDLAKLQEPELYLEAHRDKLVILDEIQRMPELFPILRAVVDSDRRKGRFLILGSASPDLLRQSSESLAGRIIYHELTPFTFDEVDWEDEPVNCHWFRGGFPDSYLANSHEMSYQWREAFISTFLERDIPRLGIRIPSETLRKFWTMIAHFHGHLWNGSKIASSLGVTAPTVKHYLEILQSTFLVRSLPSYHLNIKKRLVKSPKVYLRDSGLLHALLRIRNEEELLGHPAIGASWEGWVVEQIAGLLSGSERLYYYRTAAGSEIDLLVQRSASQPLLAFEIKRTLRPSLSKGFLSALDDLENVQGYLVYPGSESFPLKENVQSLPVRELEKVLA
jgi:uncharacterized protein